MLKKHRETVAFVSKLAFHTVILITCFSANLIFISCIHVHFHRGNLLLSPHPLSTARGCVQLVTWSADHALRLYPLQLPPPHNGDDLPRSPDTHTYPLQQQPVTVGGTPAGRHSNQQQQPQQHPTVPKRRQSSTHLNRRRLNASSSSGDCCNSHHVVRPCFLFFLVKHLPPISAVNLLSRSILIRCEHLASNNRN